MLIAKAIVATEIAVICKEVIIAAAIIEPIAKTLLVNVNVVKNTDIDNPTFIVLLSMFLPFFQIHICCNLG